MCLVFQSWTAVKAYHYNKIIRQHGWAKGGDCKTWRKSGFYFTDEWIKSCFSDNSKLHTVIIRNILDWIGKLTGFADMYIKHNLNMPDAVPKRDSPRLFLRDCPLTKVGELQAFLTGQGIAEEKVLKDDFEVFVSPALRCVQTAAGIAKGTNT